MVSDLTPMSISLSDTVNMEGEVMEVTPGTTSINADQAYIINYGGMDTESLTLSSSANEVRTVLLGNSWTSYMNT